LVFKSETHGADLDVISVLFDVAGLYVIAECDEGLYTLFKLYIKNYENAFKIELPVIPGPTLNQNVQQKVRFEKITEYFVTCT